MPYNETEIKCVVVGDGAVGKTCLVKVYVDNKFPEGYIPTVFENTYLIQEYRGFKVNLGIWDTAGQEDYVVDPNPFENVRTRWLPEVTHHCPHVPIVLAATKTDLREDPASLKLLQQRSCKPVTTQEVEQFAKEIKAFSFQECSSKLNSGIKELFEKCIQAVLFPNEGKEGSKKQEESKKKKDCLMM
ncbi:hypothetical protein FDP41_003655 [Naegleria fowleri]|uniref:Uncharacterized protein n=1 Tax=Naegleria fowleri TaxID=5763 RepID=A0A6A5BQM6_NAEFO|nr:uncharacterized protein FDP41_003655 [Naegleria fowleri]KAF0977002.1 hypothetical protein FDP41_003655 [Naegleria fowleri]